jgi:hypothetical protein
MMDDDFSSLLLRKRKREKIERSLFRVFNPIVFEKTKEASALSLSGAFFHIERVRYKVAHFRGVERAYHHHFFCALERKETSLLRKMEIPRARRRRRIKRR